MPKTSWARRVFGFAHNRTVHSRRVRVLARHFATLIPARHSVLDVGCGDGLIDALILQQRPDLAIAGVDVLVRNGSHIPVTRFDGKYLPYPDGSWDTVLFCDTLHHTDDPLAMLREAVRVARQCVVIKDHTVQGLLARPTLRIMDYLGNAPHGVALPYNYLTAQQWEQAFTAAGLKPVEIATQLALYPGWADAVFGRSLHFMATCEFVGRPPTAL